MADVKKLAESVRDVPDFPKPGILFKDITTLIKDPALFSEVIDWFVETYNGSNITSVAAIEARGYLFASAVAYRLKAGLVPIRKPGKLPADTISVSYDLEYGSDSVEVHRDAFEKGSRVLLIDDLLATGGTAGAACQLIEKAGAEVVSVAFVIELDFLSGKDKLAGYDVRSLIHF